MDRNKAWQAWILTIVLAFSSLISFTSAQAAAPFAATLCGDGSAPDYGFTYDLQQSHWTVDWENYVLEQTVNEVDRVFDRLNGDSIAQTMILFQPQDQVGIRTNCAVHFLRYMQLGLPTGERKDNGFVFLIVVENNSIDVHYAVGLGLPALTANELTNINRATEDAYDSTKSLDQALLTLVDEFDKVARSNYEPVVTIAPTPESIDVPSGPAGILVLCCVLCLVMLFVLFLIWILSQAGRGGGGGMFPSSGSRSSWGRGFPSGGFSSNRGRSSPPSRGGSGSGRSGRTN